MFIIGCPFVTCLSLFVAYMCTYGPYVTCLSLFVSYMYTYGPYVTCSGLLFAVYMCVYMWSFCYVFGLFVSYSSGPSATF